MVFNLGQEPPSESAMNTDSDLIDHLGGPAKVAELLGFDKHGGTQRVQNWKTRGIPAAVKLAYPSVFLSDKNEPKTQAA
jgi:hypothetical protein